MLLRKSLAMLVFAVLIILPPVSTMARTITVDDDGPADYSSIREAVEAASEGDTVLVEAGVYYEYRIEMKHNLLLKGAGIDSSIIINNFPRKEGPLTSYTVHFEVEGAKIEGFTISGSASWRDKAGITIVECSPTIIHNKIINCGYGIVIRDCFSPAKAQPIINGNIITDNMAGVLVDPGPPHSQWDPNPPLLDQWDVRWNWWGTTDEAKIASGIRRRMDGPLLYTPWLTEPVVSFQETSGIHYNNIYGNDAEAWRVGEVNFVYGESLFVSVEASCWGRVKYKFK